MSFPYGQELTCQMYGKECDGGVMISLESGEYVTRKNDKQCGYTVSQNLKLRQISVLEKLLKIKAGGLL